MNASATSSTRTRAHRPAVTGWLQLLLSFSVGTGAAPALAAEELPGSDACHVALKALEQAEATLADPTAASAPAAAAAERQRALAAKLYPQRKRVADACLGGLTTSPSPSQHTWVVPPPPRATELVPRRLAMPGPASPPAPTPSPIPVPRYEAPVIISTCNAATCLASDGSVLTRVGPNLVGPRGTCTSQGGFLRCP